MKHISHYLFLSKSLNITDTMFLFKKGFQLITKVNCTLEMTNQLSDYCNDENLLSDGQTIHIQSNKSRIFTVKVSSSLAYLKIRSLDSNQLYLISFYLLPERLIKSNKNYNTWVWGKKKPGLILIPNLKNEPELYFKLKFKEFTVIKPNQVQKTNINSKTDYITPDLKFKFYLNERVPITIYSKKNGKFRAILGMGHDRADQFTRMSEFIDPNSTFYVSCHDVISHRTRPIIRVMIGVVNSINPNKPSLIYSDQIIFRISPIILTPNCLPISKIYASVFPDSTRLNNNLNFVKEVEQILDKEGYPYQMLKTDKNISTYHRWMQDILKMVYCTDGHTLQYIILKGPRFNKHHLKNENTSYIYDFFKDYPMYDLRIPIRSLNGFGNVQVIPPIYPEWPFGRVIYGTSTTKGQPNISYNLISLLESQEIQKPLTVDTGWLHVGHVDEILTFLGVQKGFRIQIASPKKFYDLISELNPETLIFDPDKPYVFSRSKLTDNVRNRFVRKYTGDTHNCMYRSQLSVRDILNWDELTNANAIYQVRLDEVKAKLIAELGVNEDTFDEVPIYYWPPSVSKSARSLLPNMINSLNVGDFMLIPKPHIDMFEQYYRSIVPEHVRLYFVDNWDSYYLLDGDINCGTATKREPFERDWWSHKPESAFDV